MTLFWVRRGLCTLVHSLAMLGLFNFSKKFALPNNQPVVEFVIHGLSSIKLPLQHLASWCWRWL
jgi:hypothetical protein